MATTNFWTIDCVEKQFTTLPDAKAFWGHLTQEERHDIYLDRRSKGGLQLYIRHWRDGVEVSCVIIQGQHFFTKVGTVANFKEYGIYEKP